MGDLYKYFKLKKEAKKFLKEYKGDFNSWIACYVFLLKCGNRENAIKELEDTHLYIIEDEELFYLDNKEYFSSLLGAGAFLRMFNSPEEAISALERKKKQSNSINISLIVSLICAFLCTFSLKTKNKEDNLLNNSEEYTKVLESVEEDYSILNDRCYFKNDEVVITSQEEKSIDIDSLVEEEMNKVKLAKDGIREFVLVANINKLSSENPQLITKLKENEDDTEVIALADGIKEKLNAYNKKSYLENGNMNECICLSDFILDDVQKEIVVKLEKRLDDIYAIKDNTELMNRMVYRLMLDLCEDPESDFFGMDLGTKYLIQMYIEQVGYILGDSLDDVNRSYIKWFDCNTAYNYLTFCIEGISDILNADKGFLLLKK